MTAATPLSPRVIDALNFFFDDQARAEAAALLLHECGQGMPVGHADLAERIRLAVLKVADGDRAELKAVVVAAKLDWRDVLVAADFADDVEAHVKWAATLSRPAVPALPNPMTALATLIDEWCETRQLRALSQILPAYFAVNGLTDGWEGLRDAVRSLVHADPYAARLRDVERALDVMLGKRS